MYRHTQFSWILIGILGVGAIVPIALGVAGTLVAIWLLGTIALLTFGALTVTIDETALSIRFGPGITFRRVALASLRSWRRVRNKWYYGWGIRLYPGGVLYNVSGLDAVELYLDDGTRLRVGTDEPEALMAAIQQRRGEPESIPPGGLPVDRRGRRRWLLAPIIFAVVVLGIVAAAISVQRRPPDISVTAAEFSVTSGAYGVTVPIADIASVSLEPSLPPIRLRTNGFAFGATRRGHFLLEGMGRGQLFTQDGPPYVLIRTPDTFVFVNTDDEARTRQLYQDLIAATGRP